MAPKTEQTDNSRRKYPRHKAPKGLFVGWKTAGQRTVSLAETIGLGGLFLYTPNPPSRGSIIELIFDLKSGEVRARAVVRNHSPGKGMGVQFVQMQAADRARLNQFLSKYAAAQPAPAGNVESKTAMASASASKVDAAGQLERELSSLLELARKGTYYQLLGTSPDSTAKQIKQNFYALAQKFHPDHHMESQERMGRLKELMGVATSAYKTLADEEARAKYDANLAASGAHSLRRGRTTPQEAIEECFGRATECLRAGNFVGSIVWLRKCAETSPDDARYHALLARSLSSVSQYRDEAIAEFQRAIELDPLNTVPYIQFAELYESMQLPSRASLLYSKVLEIDPANAKAHQRLAQLDNAQPA
ncbi:MAG: DnaJ domain-containing protein [Candidatus Acidiferrales bacterium]|jgi:tetratricopeptide (TPR) repeat protein